MAKSKTELDIEKKLKILENHGFINYYNYESKIFILSEKFENIINKKRFTLFNKKIYTPDFEIVWNEKIFKNKNFIHYSQVLSRNDLKEKIIYNIINNTPVSFFEVKPDNFDFQNMERNFKRIQPIIFEKYLIYIQIIKPSYLDVNKILKN